MRGGQSFNIGETVTYTDYGGNKYKAKIITTPTTIPRGSINAENAFRKKNPSLSYLGSLDGRYIIEFLNEKPQGEPYMDLGDDPNSLTKNSESSYSNNNAANGSVRNKPKENTIREREERNYQHITKTTLPPGITPEAAFAAWIIISLGAFSGALEVRCPEEDEVIDLEPEMRNNEKAYQGLFDLLSFYKEKAGKDYFSGLKSVGAKLGSVAGLSEILSKEKTINILREIKDQDIYQISLCDYKLLVNRFLRDIFPTADMSQIKRYSRKNRVKNYLNKTRKAVSGVGSRIYKEAKKLPYTTATVLMDAGPILFSLLGKAASAAFRS
jgi:hypothetical protein